MKSDDFVFKKTSINITYTFIANSKHTPSYGTGEKGELNSLSEVLKLQLNCIEAINQRQKSCDVA